MRTLASAAASYRALAACSLSLATSSFASEAIRREVDGDILRSQFSINDANFLDATFDCTPSRVLEGCSVKASATDNKRVDAEKRRKIAVARAMVDRRVDTCDFVVLFNCFNFLSSSMFFAADESHRNHLFDGSRLFVSNDLMT